MPTQKTICPVRILAPFLILVSGNVHPGRQQMLAQVVESLPTPSMTEDLESVPSSWFQPDPVPANPGICLCKLPQVDSEAEKAFFLESLALPFMEAVQFNNRFILSQGNLAKRLSVSDVCNIMTNESLGWPYERYAAVSNMVLKRDGSPCLSTSYKSYVRSLSMTSWRNIQLGSARQWTYQSCNEFGLFQTTTSNNQPFSGIPLSGLLEQCSDIFGPEFNSASLAAAVEATNEAYGGLNVTGSKIIFTNGSLDPWHILGITETIKEDLPAIFIEGESHCADIYLETPQDSLQVIQAREKMFKILETWLIEATAQRN